MKTEKPQVQLQTQTSKHTSYKGSDHPNYKKSGSEKKYFSVFPEITLNLFAQVLEIGLWDFAPFLPFVLLVVLKVELKISAAGRLQLHNSLYYSSCVLYDNFFRK